MPMKNAPHPIRILAIAAAFAALSGCNPSDTTGPGGGSSGKNESFKAQDGSVELDGFIEAVGEMELVVFGHTVTVTDTTEILGDSNDPLRFDDLLVGMWTEIRGTTSDGSNVLAERIEVEIEDHAASASPGR